MKFEDCGHSCVDRTIVKLVVNTMINAESAKASFLSICEDLRYNYKLPEPGLVARSLIDKVAATYPALDRYWSTGIGCRLQRIDGNMCANIQSRLRQLNVPCLSVHDSFIVPAEHRALLVHLMDEELDATRFALQHSKAL